MSLFDRIVQKATEQFSGTNKTTGAFTYPKPTLTEEEVEAAMTAMLKLKPQSGRGAVRMLTVSTEVECGDRTVTVISWVLKHAETKPQLNWWIKIGSRGNKRVQVLDIVQAKRTGMASQCMFELRFPACEYTGKTVQGIGKKNMGALVELFEAQLRALPGQVEAFLQERKE